MPEPFNLAQTAFSSGEISPRMLGRADTEPYRFGCKLLRNAIVGRYGSAAKRWGSRFVGLNPSGKVRHIDFNLAGDDSYMIEFSAGLIRIYQGESVIAQTLVSPYSETDLDNLQYTQNSHSLFVAVGTVEPHVLKKKSTGWEFAPLMVDDSPEIRPRRKGIVIRVVQDDGGPGAAAISASTYMLRSSERMFIPSDAEGIGRVWRVGRNWFHATQYLSPTELRAKKLTITEDDSIYGSVNGTDPIDDLIRNRGDIEHQALNGLSNWNGPWVPQPATSSFTAPSLVTQAQEGDSIDLIGGPGLTTTNGMLVEFDLNGVDAQAQNGSDVTIANTIKRLGYVFDDVNPRMVLINGKINNGEVWSGSRYWVLEDRNTPDEGISLAIHADQFSDSGRLCASSYDTETRADVFVSGHQGSLLHVNGGVVRITSVISPSMVDFDIVRSFDFDHAITTEWSFGWSDWSGYPKAIEIHQDRLCLAGVEQHPDYVLISKTSRYKDFKLGAIGDDAMALRLAGGGVEIVWLRSAIDLLIGTDDQEYALKGSPLSPTRLGIDRNSNYGSSGVQPLYMGPRVLFVSGGGHELRAIEFTQDLGRYQAPSLAGMSNHYFAESRIKRIEFYREPEQLVFALLENGDLLCLGYRPDQGILAWSKWEGLSVESIATRSIGDSDELWLSLTDGYTVIVDPTAILDAQVSGTTGLSHLEGQSVQVSVNGTFIGTEVVNNSQVTSRTGTVVAGLPIEFRFQPVEIEPGGQEQGDSQARDRTYSEINYLVHESFGGEVLLDDGNTTQVVGRAKTDPAVYESGWKEVNVNEDYLPVLVHDTPHKFEILATTQSVEIGAQ